MIGNGEFFMINELKEKGMSITQIAEKLGRDRKTIRRWLKEDNPPTHKRSSKRKSKLDPHKDHIRRRMEEGCYNAVVLLDEIRSQHYTGGMTILREFMKPLRPVYKEKATVRFETEPGDQAQVDWGKVSVDWHGQKKQLYVFVMVLGYSRMSYVEFIEDEKLDTLIGCHIRALAYFGGTTRTCLYDNMKTVVLGSDEKGEVIWNERFAAFAKHHQFSLRRCKPYRPQTKGKVESGVGYVKNNFWPRVRTFENLSDLNQQARHWVDTIANIRVHGTTHEVPKERWEKESLIPMNDIPFETAERYPRKVSFDCFVSYQANRYSVPFKWVGQTVFIQDDKNGHLRIYVENACIAKHTKITGQHQTAICPEHVKGLSQPTTQSQTASLPRLVGSADPEVSERPLDVYDQFAEEAVSSS